MLKAATEEQRRHIEEILNADGPENYVNWGSRRLNYEYIFFEGTLTFNQMAAIVDFLREQNLTPFQKWAKDIGIPPEKVEGIDPSNSPEITLEQVERAVIGSHLATLKDYLRACNPEKK